MPPLRLDFIKHLTHPSHSSRCLDRDCIERGCKGNRLEVLDDPTSEHGGKGVKVHVVHGKNDKRLAKACYNINFSIPHGDLLKLLLTHITVGHEVMSKGKVIKRMFFSCSELPFSNATFIHYWEKLMSWDARDFGLQYFPPSAARKIFIEDYTALHGAEPDMLDGAAAVMGNTVKQWKASYWPSRRRRLAGMVVAARHAEIVAGANDEGEMEDGPMEA